MKIIFFRLLIIYYEKYLIRFLKLNIYILFFLIFCAFFIHFLIEYNVINIYILIITFKIYLLNCKYNEKRSISFFNIEIIDIVLKYLIIIVIIYLCIISIFF